MHTQHAHFKLPRSLNEVCLHWFPAPPFRSLFHPFPFSHTFFPPFASCLSLLHVLSSHSFPSRPHIALGLSPGSDNEVWFTVCPCAFGSLFIATTYTFVPSVLFLMFSYVCPRCAHRDSVEFALYQQRGNLVSIAGCPTKRAMPRLMWSLINSTYLLLFELLTSQEYGYLGCRAASGIQFSTQFHKCVCVPLCPCVCLCMPVYACV